jgi:hypothetical protein
VDRSANAIVRERITFALRRDPVDVRRHLCDRCAAQFVIGAEHVEDGRRIRQQVLAALLRQTDRIRHYHHRINFRAIGDRIDASLAREALRELIRRRGEARTQ